MHINTDNIISMWNNKRYSSTKRIEELKILYTMNVLSMEKYSDLVNNIFYRLRIETLRNVNAFKRQYLYIDSDTKKV